MSEGLPDLDDWIEERIEVVNRRDVQDHHIVNEFVEADDTPFLTVSGLEGSLDLGKEQLRNRLGELEEKRVLDSRQGANGRLYWIQDDRSEWPIPPDVEVVSEEEVETTVSEFVARPHVKLAGVAISAGFIEGIFVTAFIAIALTEIGFPEYLQTPFLVGLLLSAAVSVVFLVGAVAVWLQRRD